MCIFVRSSVMPFDSILLFELLDIETVQLPIVISLPQTLCF